MDFSDPFYFLWGSSTIDTKSNDNLIKNHQEQNEHDIDAYDDSHYESTTYNYQEYKNDTITNPPSTPIESEEENEKKKPEEQQLSLPATSTIEKINSKESIENMKNFVNEIISTSFNNDVKKVKLSMVKDTTVTDDMPPTPNSNIAMTTDANVMPLIENSQNMASINVKNIECENTKISLNNGSNTAARKICHMNSVMMNIDRNLMNDMKKEKNVKTKQYRMLKNTRKLLRITKYTIGTLIASMGIGCFVLTYMKPFVAMNSLTFKILFSSVLWSVLRITSRIMGV